MAKFEINSTPIQLKNTLSLFDILKVQIAEAEGLPLEDMVIYHQGSPVQDDVLCSSLADMSTLVVDARILGGNFTDDTVSHMTQYWILVSIQRTMES